MQGYDLLRQDPARYRGEPTESGLVPIHVPWVWSNNPDTPVEVPQGGRAFGYATAFLEPPYGIRLRPQAAQELFLAIDDAFLKNPDENSEIWRFESGYFPEDAWSPYFEWNWWGSCIWTVRTGPNELVVVGASASD